MNIIPVSPRAEMQNVDVEMFGDFDLNGDRSTTTTNNFEENSQIKVAFSRNLGFRN